MLWRAKMFLLTVPCPKGPGDPLVGTTKTEVLEWVELAFGKLPTQLICSLELHESGKTHLHMFLKFNSVVSRKGTFYFKGCVVNNARKKTGKTSAGLCVQYVCKDGYLFEIGIGDPVAFCKALLEKKSSKVALLVKAMQDGKSDKQLTLEFPEAVFACGHRIAPFRLRLDVASYERPKNNGLVILIDCPFVLDIQERALAHWVETLRRDTKYKETMHCCISSKTKSAGKSTFANMLDKVVNPPGGRGRLDFSTPWQDHLSPDMAVLICDGVSGPMLNFKMVEDLATIKTFFPKRNGGGIQWGPGPLLATSNKPYDEWGYVDAARNPMDMEVWDARFVKVQLERPLHKFNAWFASLHGLDVNDFMPVNNSSPVKALREHKKHKPNEFGGF